MEGEAEDEHDEAGGGRKRDRQRRVGTPRRQRIAAPCTTASWPSGRRSIAYGGERRTAVRERDLSTPAPAPKVGQRLAQSEDIEQRAAPKAAFAGTPATTRLLIGNKTCRLPARRPVRAGRAVEHASCARCRLDLAVRCADRSSRSATISATASMSSAAAASAWRRWSQHLHNGANADRDQEGDDQERERRGARAGSAVSRRRYAGLAIDCARPLMESGTCRRARRLGVRHLGLRSDCLTHTRDRKDVPHRSESRHWNRIARFVESPQIIFN